MALNMWEQDDSVEAIAKRLVYLRKLAKLKRNDLAKMADVASTSISLWEHAKTSGPMSSKSMAKILSALRTKGIEASERWLREGLGDSPQLVTSPTPFPPKPGTPIEVDTAENNFEENLIPKLTISLAKEMEQFNSISKHVVITKVDHTGFSPYLEKGDFVGGIWQPLESLNEEKICILKWEQKVSIGLVKKDTQKNLVSISFSLTPQPHELVLSSDIVLEQIAPILRVWR